MNWLITGVNGLQEWQQRLDHATRETAQVKRHREQLNTSLATLQAKFQHLKKAAFSRGALQRSVLITNVLEGDNMDLAPSHTALTLGLDSLQVQFKLNQLLVHALHPMLVRISVGLHRCWHALVLACIKANIVTTTCCGHVLRPCVMVN